MASRIMSKWKIIEEYPLYSVSSNGEIKNNLTNYILKQASDRDGYKQVGLCKDGIAKTNKVHRIVATAFISNPENKPTVNHKDGNKKNNNINNLEWCTNKENTSHAIQNGLFSLGEKHYLAKISDNQMSEIIILLKENIKRRDIAKRFNLTPSRITQIAKKYGIRKFFKRFKAS